MQTLGLADSTPRTENRFRALLWPTIRNDVDLEYITQQGFWICAITAAVSFVAIGIAGSWTGGVFEGLFFFLAGVGVRQRSRAAGITAFLAYLLSGLVQQRYTGNGFGVVRIIFLALLFANIRGNWLASRWGDQSTPPPLRLDETWTDKFSGRLPRVLWPKARFVYYVLATIELGLLLLGLFAPNARS